MKRGRHYWRSSIIWKKPWMRPISHKNKMFGATFQKVSFSDLHNTMTTLSLLSKDCQQALKELTCLLKCHTDQWKVSLNQEQNVRGSSWFHKMGRQPSTARGPLPVRLTFVSIDVTSHGKNLTRKPLRSFPSPLPLRILNIFTFSYKSKPLF